MSKYKPLELHFENLETESIRLTINEIEKIIGDTLPPSSRNYSAWWANDKTHVHAQAWLNVGWKVDDISLGEWAIFIKEK